MRPTIIVLVFAACIYAAVAASCPCGCLVWNTTGTCRQCKQCANTVQSTKSSSSSLRQVSKMQPQAYQMQTASSKKAQTKGAKKTNLGLIDDYPGYGTEDDMIGNGDVMIPGGDDTGEIMIPGGDSTGEIMIPGGGGTGEIMIPGEDVGGGSTVARPWPNKKQIGGMQPVVADCEPAALGCYTGKTCNNCQCCRGYMGGCWLPGTPRLSFSSVYYC